MSERALVGISSRTPLMRSFDTSALSFVDANVAKTSLTIVGKTSVSSHGSTSTPSSSSPPQSTP